MPANKGMKYPATASVCNSKEVEKLMAACPKTPTGIRDKAIIALLYRTGLRISEALALSVDDVRFDKYTINVHHGKGDKSRVVVMDGGIIEHVESWIASRPGSVDGPLFCNMRGKQMDSSYIRRMLGRLRKEAGVRHRVHAHGLRHTHAFELANEGVPIHMIKDQLGHTSVATTDRYISHLSPRERINRISERKWSQS